MTRPSADALAAATPFGVGLSSARELDEDAPPAATKKRATRKKLSTPPPQARAKPKPQIAWAVALYGEIHFRRGDVVATIDSQTVDAACRAALDAQERA